MEKISSYKTEKESIGCSTKPQGLKLLGKLNIQYF